MVRLDPPLRLATEADGPRLAQLIHEASHGLAMHFWTEMAEGADPWEVGAARQAARARDGGWVVIDEGAGAVAGLLTAEPDTEPPGPDLSPIWRPAVELEAMAPDALYVNVVATLPEARGRGFGTRLMGVAEAIARDRGKPRLSLIVADANAGARRLYDRLGYRQLAARPMVKEGWSGPGAEWLLLVKDVPAERT